MIGLFNTAVLAGVENVVNGLLDLDPDGRRKLGELSGSLLEIEITSPPLPLSHLYLLVHDHGIGLSARQEREPDTIIRGTAAGLLNLLRGDGNAASLYGKGMDIAGDVDKARHLQRILAGMKIDWEYQLSRLIGDIPTQGISDALRSGREFADRGRDSLIQDLDEYLHEEKQLFPDRRELALFYSLVDKLRLDTDRLEARVERLAERVDQSR